VASTSNSASPWDGLHEADHDRCQRQVQPSVPGLARGVGQSRSGGRRGGDAKFGTKVRGEAVARREPLAKTPLSSAVTIKISVKGHGMRLILIWAALAASTASPWWLLNGEPRPQCATCPAVASTSNSASPWDGLHEADHDR